ncbi:partial ATP-dependent DNA helicase RecQ, partial [Anaerolineae bacterium]
PVFALTATATPQVQSDIIQQLGLAHAEKIVTGFNRPNLSFTVRYTPSDQEKQRALKALVGANESGIIYTGTRREAEEIAAFVNASARQRAAHYHAGLDDATRTRTQDDFMRDQIPIIVATNAFGMGVDKPNIGFVIHYNLPATVEAYYQEVGRAGRDGKPARGVLLYSPKDRALQEWFIENDAPTPEQTLALYRILPRGERQVAPLDLQRQLKMSDTKLRLALRQLESVGAVQRIGDQYGAMLLRVASLARLDLSASAAEIERYREYKHRKLAQMIRYAETNHCRRRYILAYFGDPGSADATECCDNHVAKTSEVLKTLQVSTQVSPDATDVALMILACVGAVSGRIGRSGVSKILTASRAQGIQRFERNPFYGKLAQFKRQELDDLVLELIQKGYIKVIGGEYPVVTLAPSGAHALKTRAAIPLAVPQKSSSAETARVERKIGTVEMTRQLLARGMTPAEIAKERGVTVGTIYTHLAQLIEQGAVDIDAIIPRDVQAQIQVALSQAALPGLTEIKLLLPETISYDEIRCVVAASKLRIQGPAPIKPITEETDAPLSPDDQIVFDALRNLRTEFARAEQVPPFVILHDRTLRAIARQRPQSLDALRAINGIGQSKLERYGEPVIAVVQKFARR